MVRELFDIPNISSPVVDVLVECIVGKVELADSIFVTDTALLKANEMFGHAIPATDSEYAKYCDEVGWDLAEEGELVP